MDEGSEVVYFVCFVVCCRVVTVVSGVGPRTTMTVVKPSQI